MSWKTALLTALPLVAAYTQLSDDSLAGIPEAGADFDIHDGSLLAPILIPRVPGTPGSEKVQRHFVSFFADKLPKWSLEWNNSTSKTPATGDDEIPFRNLIFRRDPPWARPGDVSRLTLVAHYDSLVEPKGFIGAIDSAAPCAMLLHVARSIDAALTAKWEQMEAQGSAGDDMEEEKGVQIMLLDGEEAWEQWTDDDSLYGARALAESWDNTAYPATSHFRNPLQSISLFVLLDLLGAANPTVPSYFPVTHWAYQHMAKIEERMRQLNLLNSRPRSGFFLPEAGKTRFTSSMVGDDHVPFMKRGVEILHLIPNPFPFHLWHKMEDDGEHLDGPTVQDWAKIVAAFAAEWMDLEGRMPEKRWSNKTEL